MRTPSETRSIVSGIHIAEKSTMSAAAIGIRPSVVLLSWHYAEVIIKRLKAAGLKSDFVIPLPDLRIVKNSKV
ncbi:hypothetical protein A3C21_02855 [Candidatus Kaiserbacteria bacterium RIFCSPHIGHO2_02_FULL_59_21]|uniref:Uncharacterized protein n=1 Tax=Candidatus Kaiserbacteria bacterium RIFCSPHIGHO2_02_FULL_59_21 TaxID=1798500 RepID=A0A1F6DYS7_9BACT|nr:MAG: hypothetical protein A3C21_02855 [Candidatus Kaiserbacteria bacterium RIFCSPHIGHO2_02_FULL_59_21]OGG79021.1 MAG: hypothetical protein A2952_01500 [Candidatus Kaiserbacteria bacterium RIFCSPLOWO2_01_FULL_59_34]OGG84355.1 MAG: hypothetical protein A3I47_01705 [Candidatus Kaiserbacteria bacterium RIFCSPLOWO2_02_FULL_59_19]